jgi:hypothetical protein
VSTKNRRQLRFTQVLLVGLMVGASVSAIGSIKAEQAAAAQLVRINAGATKDVVGHNGDVWLAEAAYPGAFSGGGTVNRGNIAIANTLDPALFQTEHYGMSSFSAQVPNGFYWVNLFFAETYAGITGPGQRVFSVDIEGHSIGNIDVFAEAGGAYKAIRTSDLVWIGDDEVNITFTALVNNAEINAIEIVRMASPTPSTTPTPSPSVTPSGTPNPLTARIDAGSAAAVSDHNGNAWLADQGFTGGGIANRGAIAIANTLDPVLYQTEHWGMSAFARPVVNGTYTVNLLFAETYGGITGPGQRVFSVNVEGVAISNIDVFAEAGGARRALTKTAQVTVLDGVLNMTFTAKVNNPEINGIEIIPGYITTPTPAITPTPSPTTVVRVDSGSTVPVTDRNGNVWAADFGCVGGGMVNRGAIAVASATYDPILFRTERYGMTSCAYTVPNGAYDVNLFFAETYAGVTGVGQRVFNVNVEGTAINGIDPFAQAGGPNKALVKTVAVNVADGVLNISFAAKVGNPEINGIEILAHDGLIPTPSPTQIPTPT